MSPLFALSLLAVSVALPAQAAEIPPDSKVIEKISQATTPARGVAEQVRLLNWNILKGERGAVFTRDIQDFSRDRNLVLLQEGYQSELVKSALGGIPSLSFTMANAFRFKGEMTGVISGFADEPLSLAFRRSPHNEPILNSPKMTMLSSFRLSETSTLLVANVHGINFVGPDKFAAQLKDIGDELAKHTGPLILAGDFNTWNESRMALLDELAKRLGLQEVAFEGNPQKSGLDHVFQRGCSVEKAWIKEKVESSDHDPQFVDMKCAL